MSEKIKTTFKQESENQAKTAMVHSIETMGLVDGPGIRTLFFLQGCPLRCAFCHNPDTQPFKGGQEMTARDILKTAQRYQNYYGEEGGVTFSGGEPLAQAEFLAEALPLLKENGISVCLDTSSYGQIKFYDQVLPYVDVMLLDIKAFSHFAFKDLVEAEFSVFLNFINKIDQYGFKGKIWLRHVMVPGLTDNEEAMHSFVDMAMPFAHLIDRIEILPYHTMGIDKYEEMGQEYRLHSVPAMDKEEAKRLEIYANKLFSEKFKNYRENDKKFDREKQKMLKRNANFQLATALLDFKEKYSEKSENLNLITLPEAHRDILEREMKIGKAELTRKLGEFKDLGYIKISDNQNILLLDEPTLYNYQIQ